MTDQEIIDQLNGKRKGWHRWSRIVAVLFALAIVVGAVMAIVKNYNSEPDVEPYVPMQKATSGPAIVVSDTAISPETDTVSRGAITLSFGGDITLEDNSQVMQNMKAKGKGLEGSIDSALIQMFKDSDSAIINNEFCYSKRGTPLAGKDYTFRANPKNIKYLKQMGIDVVSLANNHVFDYGEDAFMDTLSTIDNAGIKRMGAGKDESEASKPVYLELKGKKIALVAATRAEHNAITQPAGEDKPGVFRCYDNAKYIKAIKEAKKNADYVIAYVHWGTEYHTSPDQYQLSQGKDYINAGADVIVGSHTHCLQGAGYYKGKPIFYSLGNFWFNARKLYTTVLQLTINEDGKIEAKMQPCVQQDRKTKLLTKESDIKAFRNYVNQISTNAKLDKDCIVTKK